LDSKFSLKFSTRLTWNSEQQQQQQQQQQQPQRLGPRGQQQLMDCPSKQQQQQQPQGSSGWAAFGGMAACSDVLHSSNGGICNGRFTIEGGCSRRSRQAQPPPAALHRLCGCAGVV